MAGAPLIEIPGNGAPPRAVDGSQLDPSNLHDWLALPIQHFMDKHPEQTREEILDNMAEVLAELIGSSTPSWLDARRLLKRTVDCLTEQTQRKFKAFERLRHQTPE